MKKLILSLLLAAAMLSTKAQKQVETTLFDNAVKKQNNQWTSFADMSQKGKLNEEGKKILESIDSLNLSNFGLTKLPKEVIKCSNLKYLNLENNQLSGLPSKIGGLKKIKKIVLTNNKFKKIPKGIKNCENINYLKINSNPLTKSSIKKLPKLEYLDVWDSELDTLCAEILDFFKSESINYKVNRFGFVKYYNPEKGFGYIIDIQSKDELFVYENGLIDEISENINVTFDKYDTRKGIEAINVRIAKAVIPFTKKTGIIKRLPTKNRRGYVITGNNKYPFYSFNLTKKLKKGDKVNYTLVYYRDTTISFINNIAN